MTWNSYIIHRARFGRPSSQCQCPNGPAATTMFSNAHTVELVEVEGNLLPTVRAQNQEDQGMKPVTRKREGQERREENQGEARGTGEAALPNMKCLNGPLECRARNAPTAGASIEATSYRRTSYRRTFPNLSYAKLRTPLFYAEFTESQMPMYHVRFCSRTFAIKIP